jgi:hypothetical protein
MDQFRLSIESKVDNPLATIERFNRQFQIGEKEREAVQWAWKQKMGKTMFHVVNAYTRAVIDNEIYPGFSPLHAHSLPGQYPRLSPHPACH